MALSSCLFSNQLSVSLRIDSLARFPNQRRIASCETTKKGCFGQHLVGKDVNRLISLNFLEGSRVISKPNPRRNTLYRKSSVISASWLPSSHIASSAFTWGTIAVLPFYTFMVVAPQAEFTKKLVASSTPYVLLGILYAYLLYLSWTPDTIHMMFASKYWLPELPGIAKMFSSEMTLASAWIHLLAVDLFAARQVYLDGLQDKVETRHSVSLCLLFCPIGILTHFITKAITTSREKTGHGIH